MAMAEHRSSTGSPDSEDCGLSTVREHGGDRGARYAAYRPPDGEFTPPASPQPSSPYTLLTAKDGFAAHETGHPETLQTENRNTSAYERTTYSPSPSSSPTLSPSLPSPYLPLRHRASYLRRQAASSALNPGHPRAEQPPESPTPGPAPPMMKQAGGPGPISDPRTMFNPLASNPVNAQDTSWRMSRGESWTSQNRARGLTSSSSPSQPSQPFPALRSATSIADYNQYRGDRSNLSGAYRPNRGGNWSHNDHYNIPVRPYRADEPRDSLSWTIASSSFVDASGTERSSMATSFSDKRSENRSSFAVKEPLEDVTPYTEYDDGDVDDLLDFYCSNERDEIDVIIPDEITDVEPPHRPPSVAESLPGLPEKQSPKQDLDRDAYRHLSQLPRLPETKCRMSRQDLAQFQAYADKYAKRLDPSVDGVGEKPSPVPQSPVKQSAVLPEIDQDAVRPRRASTSVFDRRSVFLQIDKALPAKPPIKSPTTDFGNDRPTGKRKSNGTVFLRPAVSPHERDRYGFKKATDKITVEQYDVWYNTYEDYVQRRRGKWIALMHKQQLPTDEPHQFPDRCDRVKRYVRKGFPPEWRGAMWWYYSNSQFDLGEVSGIYSQLVARVRNEELNKDDREAIERDLDRTFPDNVHFKPNPIPGQAEDAEPKMIQNLREVLQCFALHNPQIGYCQSLNFIAGLLLLFLGNNVERVFILMHIITKYHLPKAHARNLENTEVKILMMLIKDYLPKVWASINDADIINNGLGSHAHPDAKFQRLPSVNIACTSWFMSLFINVLPIETVLRIWDSFFYEGPRTLFKYALAIFKLAEPELRRLDPSNMAEIYMTIQDVPRKCLSPHILYDLVFTKKHFNSVDNNLILEKRMFWREQVAKDQSVRGEANPVEKEGLGVKTTLRRKASKRFWKKNNMDDNLPALP
ncbi:RabGAP/TBC [Lojkania enalia]|uniref:RabGAP/TBC n=1 Tax=Lojkania enalia TaxID=147567 RepID=A0A9P4KC59_9PLEO|nr:RabGAP/TBC [Didymosphaeria enalia]